MEANAIKLMSYFGLLAVVAYAVFSAMGKRNQVIGGGPGTPNYVGALSARKSVPAASSQAMAAGVYPTPPVNIGWQN
jgi:hypothetical protein